MIFLLQKKNLYANLQHYRLTCLRKLASFFTSNFSWINSPSFWVSLTANASTCIKDYRCQQLPYCECRNRIRYAFECTCKKTSSGILNTTGNKNTKIQIGSLNRKMRLYRGDEMRVENIKHMLLFETCKRLSAYILLFYSKGNGKVGKIQTMDMAFSTSSLFRPAIRPLKDSRASLSFFKITCPFKEATSLSFAWIFEKQTQLIHRSTTEVHTLSRQGEKAY